VTFCGIDRLINERWTLICTAADVVGTRNNLRGEIREDWRTIDPYEA
jgi:hypothetical protein